MGQGRLCGARSASLLSEQVAGVNERLGEAARADDNRRVVASRLDVQHQVAVLEDRVAVQLAGGRQLGNAVVGRLRLATLTRISCMTGLRERADEL